MKPVLILCLLFTFSLSFSQSVQPPFTPAKERLDGFEKRKALQEQSILNGIKFRSVGPSVFSGRVVDLEVSPTDPSHFYVAYASGGLWKTENNGMSFTPLFDNEVVMTIGDIAVDWERNIIWVGTGEVNSSRSSYAGVGMYKSEDGGKSWQHYGLTETHHIGRVILHPTDPNTLWVAALGHLYSPNEERGIFKTTDGGKSWTKTLFVNSNAGAIDLVIDPDNPQLLYAATWERERRAWDFIEGGKGSGIYKSMDGGNNWKLITNSKSGFPTGKGVGRIGLALGKKKGKTVLFAALDNYFRRPKEKEKQENILTKDDLREMNKEDFLKLENYKVKDYLASNNFPKKYNVKTVTEKIKKGEITPKTLVEYTEDANSLLFDTPVIGLEVYRSDDEGKSWTKTHEKYLDGVYYSYGYYFGTIRVSPSNADKLYIMGVPVIKSDDAGKTWESINGDNVHVDHHALWVNPNRPGHLILGNDGGINISYDDGKKWIKCNTPAVGQFYYVAVDMAQPYNIYGGLQDNGVWMGPSTYKANTRWHSSGQYPFKSIMGGDGMQVAVDTRDNKTVYTGFQFGNYFRVNTQTRKRKYITPKHELGERPLRWNWQAPIHLSIHNQDIFYMGSNKLHRSFNRGDDFEEISDDLTTGGRQGDVAFSTLTTIHESPLKFGLIYTGSDDGLAHVTRDGGFSWVNISKGLPKDMWIARIQASKFVKGRVYVCLNGYRWDDFKAYLYVSEDYGSNWQAIGSNLPAEPLNVVKEDPNNQEILYVGSDHGLYLSLDRGKSFMLMNEGLPAVSVHDVVVHPRDKELLVGTHGRSMYIGNVKELQQFTPSLMEETLHVFALAKTRYRSNWGNSFSPWRPASEPSLSIPIYVKEAGTIKLQLQMAEGLELHQWEANLSKGLNYVPYDLSINEETLTEYNKSLNKGLKKGAKPILIKKAKNDKAYAYKGKYKLLLEKDGEKVETELVIE